MLQAEPDPEIDALARRVIGACIEVHRYLGAGFAESVYEEALCLELERSCIQFERQVGFAVTYKGVDVGYGRLDLLVEGSLVVELKAVDALGPIHLAQVIAYLKGIDKQLGLLINFNTHQLRQGIRRVINIPV